MEPTFIADGPVVYAATVTGRVAIANAESETWADTIADALNNDPDVYVV